MITLSCQPLSSRERARSGRGATRHRRKMQRLRKASAGLKGQREAKITQATIDRLLSEASTDARFEGMSSDEISAYLLPKIEVYRKSLPWWSGHFDKPRSKGTQQQPEGLKRFHEQRRQELAERERKLNQRLETYA